MFTKFLESLPTSSQADTPRAELPLLRGPAVRRTESSSTSPRRPKELIHSKTRQKRPTRPGRPALPCLPPALPTALVVTGGLRD